MGWLFSRVLELEWLDRSLMIMNFTFKGSIAWLIILILQSRFCPNWTWWATWKTFSKLYIFISANVLKGIWNFLSLLKSWKQKEISFEECENKMDIYVGSYQKNYGWISVKMAINFTFNFAMKANLDLLCDIEVFYGLNCLLPLLEYVNSLMKLAQAWDVFVVDYVVAIKTC
jgi:hypothetical protein